LEEDQEAEVEEAAGEDLVVDEADLVVVEVLGAGNPLPLTTGVAAGLEGLTLEVIQSKIGKEELGISQLLEVEGLLNLLVELTM